MSLDDLRPSNSKKARECSVQAFKRFLNEENVSLVDVEASICKDSTGATLIALMDRFGVYLAHLKTRNGTGPRRNTVGQYFRQVKLWLYERFPHFSQLVDGAILAKGRTLERFSGMRPGGKTVKQAPACTKAELHALTTHIYSNATVPADYQDATLLVLLWYLFGRASDLAMLEKQNLSLCAENVVFVRFLRMKTSEQQGLTLFPDSTIATCPITAVAAALVLQISPSSALLPHLPQPVACDMDIHGSLVPLSAVLAGAAQNRDLLGEVATNETADSGDEGGQKNSRTVKSGPSAPGIHAYVNRVLNRVAIPANVKTSLSSHSFRRGGAQHVNGKPGLSPHWIADRGGWNMSMTNKVFTYIFNTTKEDQTVAKLLNRYDEDDEVEVLDLKHFDAVTRSDIELLKKDLFSTCMGLAGNALNVSSEVIDVLLAYLIKAFPIFKSMNDTSPIVIRMEHAMKRNSIEIDRVMAWSSHLVTLQSTTSKRTDNASSKHLQMMEHQAAVIDQLIDLSKMLSERLRSIEAKVEPTVEVQQLPEIIKRKGEHDEAENAQLPPKRRKKQNTNLVDVWYEWYAGKLYLTSESKHLKSTARRCIAYMLLFVDSLELDPLAPSFRDDVLRVGRETSQKVAQFLSEQGMSAASAGTAEKKFRELHKAGKLNDLITA